MPLSSISTFATGDTIESSWANTLRDNALVLDARTGGDPGAVGKIPVSNGLLGAAWLAPGAEGKLLRVISGVPGYGDLPAGAVVAHLGYTPANKAGDTFTGSVAIAFPQNLTIGGNTVFLNAAQTRFVSYDSVNDRLSIVPAVLVGGDGRTFWNSSNDGSGSLLDADMVDGIQAAAFALLAGATFTGDVILASPRTLFIYGGVLGLNAAGTRYFQYDPGLDKYVLAGNVDLLTASGAKYWHSGNDGSGSGLDAGLLEGHAASFFQVAGVSGPLPQVQYAQNSSALVFPLSYTLVNGCTITIQATGTWVIMAAAHASVASNDGLSMMQLHVNGSAVGIAPVFGDAENARRSASILYSASFTGGDVVQLRAKKASGSGGSQIDTAAIVAFRTA